MKKETSEYDFLKNYNPNTFERPNVSVDTVIYTVHDNALKVLLVQRAEHPFKDQWTLAGGYINIKQDEDIEATARRKLEEKTGVKTPYLEQYATYGNRTRDPRHWSVTTVYFALLPYNSIVLQKGSTANDSKWVSVKNGKVNEKLGFDHEKILEGCTERLKNKVLYTSLPLHLMPETFTLHELQTVYETILETTIEHKSFRRRIIGANLVEETGEMRQTGHRPAMLYQRSKNKETHIFLRNLEAASS